MLMAKTSFIFLTVQYSFISDSNKCQYVVCGAALLSEGRGEGGRGVLPMMAYTGRLRPKGIPFFSQYTSGLGSVKGPKMANR